MKLLLPLLPLPRLVLLVLVPLLPLLCVYESDGDLGTATGVWDSVCASAVSSWVLDGDACCAVAADACAAPAAPGRAAGAAAGWWPGPWRVCGVMLPGTVPAAPADRQNDIRSLLSPLLMVFFFFDLFAEDSLTFL